MRAFLLEDDRELNETVHEFLEQMGLRVDPFFEATEALKSADKQYDIYLLDINVPNGSGFDVLRKVKASHPMATTITISANRDIETVLEGYKLGCTDYLRKPFDLRELKEKIKIHLKLDQETVRLKRGITYNKKNAKVFLRGDELALTPNERLLIEKLALNKGQAVPNRDIIAHIWGEEEVDEVNLRSLVLRTRKKLPDDVVLNHKGVGYKVV